MVTHILFPLEVLSKADLAVNNVHSQLFVNLEVIGDCILGETEFIQNLLKLCEIQICNALLNFVPVSFNTLLKLSISTRLRVNNHFL